MMKQMTPPKKQSRSTSVEIKAIDLSIPGSILFAASESNRGASSPMRIKTMLNGTRTDFFVLRLAGDCDGVFIVALIVTLWALPGNVLNWTTVRSDVRIAV
jgi:hypothetical protein